MFAVKHHVTLGGVHYLPGEVIDGPVPDWWLSVGAVEQINDGPESGTTPLSGEETGEIGQSEDPEGEDDQEPEEADKIDQSAEPEEIDVSAGIVSPPTPAKPKKPRKNGGK